MGFIKKFNSYQPTESLKEGAYMYPIQIKREPQIIEVKRKVDLEGDTLTLADLKEYGVTEEDSFRIIEEENNRTYSLYIYSQRLETQDEVEARVAKEEQYMKNYTAFHQRNKR